MSDSGSKQPPHRTLILQSHRDPLPFAWLGPCLASVRDWAAAHGYSYRFLDDELLEALPDDIRDKTRDRPVIGSDLARLIALERVLEEGFDRAVWCDADVLVFDPGRLDVSFESHAVGREVWVQHHRNRLRAYVKVHNAYLSFRAGDPFLPFYRDAAERMIRAHQGRMVPQLVGPKLLTALHNVVPCPVTEAAGALSPLVARDLLAGGGPALELFRARSRTPPAALNLCASQVVAGHLREPDVTALIDRLRGGGLPPG